MDSAAKYIARVYEQAIDRQLDVEGVRRYLADCGVLRSPAMVRHDLDNVYQFAGYAASHPAPEALSLAQIDRKLGY